MAAAKHVPMRKCIATGVQKPKSEMIRLVRLLNPDVKDSFIVRVDGKGKERGRGASLDNNIKAFDIAVKKGAIERALKLERKLSPDEIAELRSEVENLIAEREFRQGNKHVTLKISKADLEAKLKN